MKIKYNIIGNPQKLEQETKDINERFRILYADGVVFEFFDINLMAIWEYDQDGKQIEGTNITTYSKLTGYEEVMVNGDVICKQPLFEDYTMQFELVRNALDIIIKNHTIDYSMNIDYVRKHKIIELKEICGQVIENGIEFNGKQYSAKLEDQISIGTLIQIAKLGGNLPWHANGESCEIFTAQDFLELSDNIMAHVIYHQTYMGGIKKYLNSLEDINLINNFNYGDALTEEIELDIYNNLALLGINL